MKIERWKEESDEEWADRLAEETKIADNAETTKYFFQSGYEEDEIILNYVGEDSWTWKEHPEGPFKANRIIGWKNTAEKWDSYLEAIKDTVPHVSLADYEVLEDKLEAIEDWWNLFNQCIDSETVKNKLEGILRGSTQTARKDNED